MQGTVLYGTGDIRFEDTPEPKITKPTDAIIRLAATCVCGSDLWSYRGISPVNQPTPMGRLLLRVGCSFLPLELLQTLRLPFDEDLKLTVKN